ncbi:MAG: formylglycine-generating enzyme family protein [Treponema sp.]|jgi:formylglycine-generating enzyme required for sulfatase activity|nr:formylglycine-generating enzyme family protein [Treponema sp.]
MKKIITIVVFAGIIFALCTWKCSVPGNMVLINGGTFLIGSPENEPERSNELQRQVTVNSFYMGKYEVTQKEYHKIMGTDLGSIGKLSPHFKGDNLPVEMVTWYDAIEYCNRRSQKEGLTPAYTVNGENVTWNRDANGYRLPTEAEWEYACRAGTTTPFSTGNNITTDQANYNGDYPYNDNAKGEYRERTTPVGSFEPNAWGLYDMHGNVDEWCWDLWGYDPRLAEIVDPMSPVLSTLRVTRGGSWASDGHGLRSAYRTFCPPLGMTNCLGFRLVRP